LSREIDVVADRRLAGLGMDQTITVVDAFTAAPFAGNPAAVCFVQGEWDEPWMRAVAREMNLSETAFARGADTTWDLRWFTPTVEVDLCGHATLATAHRVFASGAAGAHDVVHFETRGGQLRATTDDDGAIALDFPAHPAIEAAAPPGLLEALGVVRAKATAAVGHYTLVELADAGAVVDLDPDITALKKVDTSAVIVTAAGDPGSGFDMVSRVFGPRVGIDEDPVTGSAHCTLGPWWGERLGLTELRARQASPRGGEMLVRLRGDRVDLVGHAVTTVQAKLVA
jgi:PhzF family phenazine biosynthesis protein